MFVRWHIPRSVSPLAERSSWFRAKNSHLRDDTKDVNEQSLNPLEPRGNYSATSNNNEVGILAVDAWTVTFGTARRGLGGVPARPGPSSVTVRLLLLVHERGTAYHLTFEHLHDHSTRLRNI